MTWIIGFPFHLHSFLINILIKLNLSPTISLFAIVPPDPVLRSLRKEKCQYQSDTRADASDGDVKVQVVNLVPLEEGLTQDLHDGGGQKVAQTEGADGAAGIGGAEHFGGLGWGKGSVC